MKDNTVLTPHFKLREFTESATAKKHGIDNRPTPEVVENLRRLCTHTLEPLREKLGLPIIITSGFRTKELNDIIVQSSRFKVQSSRFKVQSSRLKVMRVRSSMFKVQGSCSSELSGSSSMMKALTSTSSSSTLLSST